MIRFISRIAASNGCDVVMSTPASLSSSIGYFDEPAEGFVPMPIELKAVLGVTGLFNLLYFVYPAPLLEAAGAAAKSLF